MWKACKIFAYFLIATHLKIVDKRHLIMINEKYPTSSNLYFPMTFTEFQWLFRAKCNFSRPTSNSMNFQGKIEIPWLFQACMNHAEPMLTYHQWGPAVIVWGQFYKRYLSHQSLKLAQKLLIQCIRVIIPYHRSLSFAHTLTWKG